MTRKMFEMKPEYCDHYTITNGREICGLTRTEPKNCLKCAYFKNELYIPTNEESENTLFLSGKFKIIEYAPTVRECMVRISAKGHRISFTAVVAELLGYPEYIQIYENEKEKQVAMVKCSGDSPQAVKFAQNNKRGYIIQSVKLANKLLQYGASAKGEYDSSNGAVIFTFDSV